VLPVTPLLEPVQGMSLPQPVAANTVSDPEDPEKRCYDEALKSAWKAGNRGLQASNDFFLLGMLNVWDEALQSLDSARFDGLVKLGTFPLGGYGHSASKDEGDTERSGSGSWTWGVNKPVVGVEVLYRLGGRAKATGSVSCMATGSPPARAGVQSGMARTTRRASAQARAAVAVNNRAAAR
jgi:hypothetical protein